MGEPAISAKPASARRRSAHEHVRRCPTCGATYPIDFVVCPKDASPLELQSGLETDPLLGEVLAGTFLITEPLGEGGMGRVYEAAHVRLPKRFAVKVMHDKLAGHAEAMARFEREAQAVARVAHEHVLDVVDVVRAKDQRPCIVTELLQGEELGEFLERGKKVPLGTAITIARQACRGLAAAHAVGVVHRDLKPSNLFLLTREDRRVHIKILDFGVAKVMDGAELTRTGMVVGTPAFMAPEQARSSAAVDARADVYGVGAVLYRMLTGEPPFPSDEDPARTLTRLLTEDPRRPRAIDPAIPAGVEAVIQRAMARSADDRPASAMKLDELLAPFDLPGYADGARPPVSSRSREEKARIGSMATLDAPIPSPEGAAEAVTRSAQRARPVAMALALVVSLAGGAAALVTAALGLPFVVSYDPLLDANRTAITIGIAGLATLFVLFGALRVLVRRWRSAPAMQRLGDGLRASLSWLIGSLGVLALAHRGYLAFGPPPPPAWVGPIELGLVLAPTLLAFFMLMLGLRRAARVS